MTWKKEIIKNDPRHLADIADEIQLSCANITQNVGDGSDFRKETLEKISQLLKEAEMMAINVY